ncbi:TRAP-type mannitol/chloroaromatic compound transport system, periplasmic component [Gallibacterium anatis]|uniref:TRAP-type mannitol/chloroaromatic compound transport system, periplasmic component n=1 Tax=Gallibacterium anatis TaxID=750 RepID=A0A377H3V2_9PAST|nr:TRAP transporter substrate-binding protein [Gallibacterium anatis]KGQ53889.1 C4-dicarboxylate ABC transporter [Gallibacterium anatis DSM 16844 = F 149]STO37172.1 TRAP-type mannitol/chloroaromatic compound transport system, periplasmic component [Gallibacterium anatis]
MSIKRILLTTFSLFFIMSFSYAETLKLGHVTPPSHIWHKTAVRFAQNLQKISNNKFNIKIYPLSKLGGDEQMVDLLQSGAIQFAVLTGASLSNRSPSMNSWFLPYVFSNMEESIEATKTPEAQALLKDLEKQKLVGLGYSMVGMRILISTMPINNLAVLHNQKIRSYPNPLFNSWWNELDAAPTALSVSDMLPALTTNLISGVDADLDIVVGMKMYQQAPYITLFNHMTFPGVIVASKPWWDKLNQEEQRQIKEAFKEAEAWGFNQQTQQEKNNIEILKKAGVSISTPNYGPLNIIGKKVAEKYASTDPLMKKFYDRFKKAE